MMPSWAAIVGGCALLACTAPEGPGASARIAVTPGDSYVVSAIAEAAEAMSGRYTLVVEKAGPSGRSRSQQGGAFDLEAGVSATLSTSTVGVRPGDVVRVDLEVEWENGTRTEDMFEETVGSP